MMTPGYMEKGRILLHQSGTTIESSCVMLLPRLNTCKTRNGGPLRKQLRARKVRI